MEPRDKDKAIVLKKVQVHNLQAVDLTLNTNELIVFTGVSGSGKSSMAFDTIYREGQRRFVESLSTFARRQMGEMAKPLLESATGLSPTISIEQKTAGRNPRSTVGTITEVYDYMRVLFARVATPYCPISLEPVKPQSKEEIIRTIQKMEGEKVIILSPFAKGKKGEFKEEFKELMRKGYTRLRLDGHFIDLEEEVQLDRTKAHDIDLVIDRLVVKEENQTRLAESLTTALEQSDGSLSIFLPKSGEERLFSMHAYSPKSGLYYDPLEPHDFSFNSPHGMCERCHGLGVVIEFDLKEIIDPNKSIKDDCCSVGSSYQTVRMGNICDNLAILYDFSVDTKWKNLSESAKKIFLYGAEKKWIRMQFVNKNTGSTWTDHIRWQGVLYEAKKRFQEAKSDSYKKKMQDLMREQVCQECSGNRLRAYPAHARLGGKTIIDVTKMTIDACHRFFKSLTLTESEQLIAEELLKEINERLFFLLEVGLHYLTLDRASPTLSGGEAQRVRLAAQIGSGLVGITYVLDEPSIGLHPRDNVKLISTLKHLKEVGNTVIVVEHDEETIEAADRIIEFGPGPGCRGGKILVNGDMNQLLKNKDSLTADYLSGRKKIEIPKKRRRPAKESITIKGATHHNLKNIDVKIPLGVFVAVTGVSGSGKSSLISEILYPALSHKLHHGEMPVGAHKKVTGFNAIDKIIAIDQSPIGRMPRSNPATYIKVFDQIRTLFSELPLARSRGYAPGRFSFNVKEGSCGNCQGMGMIKIDMDFLEDDWMECPTCKGKRFDADTLEVEFKGHTIHDILEMEVEVAHELFSAIPSIAKKLKTLMRVGMGYIKLGQSSTTLSGGEAQRVKLAKELSRPSSGKTFYILDEPTTGLHFHDIKKLMEVLHTLVDLGNTVLVIEHNMDVVKTADWILDMGPDGGSFGGELVASGTPEKIAKCKTPTGAAVKAALERKPLQEKKRVKPKEQLITEISVKAAEQNNLKKLSLSIPREKMTVCSGPSGSGKSSFAFETLYAEGQRRYIESLSPYARQFVKQMAKPKVGQIEGLSPAVAIEQKAHAGNPRSTVGTQTEIYDYLRILYAREGVPHCPETGEVIESITKETVADQLLKYPEKHKLQITAPITLRPGQTFEERAKWLGQRGFVRLRLNGTTFDIDDPKLLKSFDPKRKNEILLIVDRLMIDHKNPHRLLEAIETATALGNNTLIAIDEEKERLFNLAFAVPSTGKSYPPITPHSFSFNHKSGMCEACQGIGMNDNHERRCPSCNGARLNPLSSAVTIDNLSLPKLTELPLQEAAAFLQNIHKKRHSSHVLEEVWLQLLHRLQFLSDVGLGYLSLNRTAPTLSGGEAQRIRLAKQLGSGLRGLLYVLDEPSIGLHAADNQMLVSALHKLKQLGNTLVVVEHEPSIIQEADQILDFGPIGGTEGGKLLAKGTPKEILKNSHSLTGLYLSGKKKVPQPLKRREIQDAFLEVKNARLHNLKGIDLKIPVHCLTCFSGVSGSGKSTLLHDIIYPAVFKGLHEKNLVKLKNIAEISGIDHFDNLYFVDQNPVGHTGRSDVSTYVDVLTPIRRFFAELPDAKKSGLRPEYFSANHYKGRCTHCYGIGHKRIELQFLPPVKVPCKECLGLRLNPLSLTVRYKGKNIGEHLQQTVIEAATTFADHPKIVKILQTLIDVGLGYLSLNQPLPTLSGGEAQRLKLSREISKRSSGNTLYLLDEPTTGLHSEDILHLLTVINHLVDMGNTMIVIEHNLDLIKNSDYLIDIGPGPGDKGGKIVASGRPEEVATVKNSKTGQFLKETLIKS